MMKAIKFLSMILAAGLLTVACSKDKETDIDPNAPVEVKFTSGIKVQTRAFDATWEDNDVIGIYMIGNTQILSDANILENAKNCVYTTVATTLGKFTANAVDKIYYPVNGDAVDFIAYYPQKATGTGVGEIDNYVYPIKTAVQTSQKAIDFMYSNNAKGHNKTPNKQNVSLTFDHMLAKVTFNLIVGEGTTAADMQAATISIRNVFTEGTFNLTNKALATTGSAGSITPLKAANSTFAEAIIIPQATSGKEVWFTVGDNVFKWTIDKNFDTGKKYQYNVTIDRTGPTVEGFINNWDPITAEDVTAN